MPMGMSDSMGRSPMQNLPSQGPTSNDPAHMYKLQLQQQQRQMNASNPQLANRPNMMQGTPMGNRGGPPMSGMTGPPNNRPMGSGINGQTINPMQQQRQKQIEEAFLNSLRNFHSARGQQLEPHPTVRGQPMAYYSIFNVVTKMGILMTNATYYDNWTFVAAQLGLPQAQQQAAAEELKALFHRSLFDFVKEWYQRRRQQQQQSQQGSPTSSAFGQQAGQMSPPNSARAFGSPQQSQMESGQPFSQQQLDPSEAAVDEQPPAGLAHGMPPATTPGAQHQQKTPDAAEASKRQSLDAEEDFRRSVSGAPSRGFDAEAQEASQTEQHQDAHGDGAVKLEPSDTVENNLDPENYLPRRREVKDPYHGGLPIDVIAELGESLAQQKPGMPIVEEMGAIDMHSLTMSIQSGMHGEIRYALDHLVSLSNESRLALDLSDCQGLLEALFDCGEDQLDFLAEHCFKRVDGIEYPRFERLARKAIAETQSLGAPAPFASENYELEHSVDRLIAITTILRNFSIPDSKNNHDMLTVESSANFIATAIRRVGQSQNMLLTARNLLDFMKDMITLLSNISHRLELLSQDDALAVLHLLIAFAPEHSPSLTSDAKAEAALNFQSYDPKRHQYLPSAIDSFAKLLARYDPNRNFYKAVFTEDRATSVQDMLLTRAFALAIAPVPDRQTSIANPQDLLRISQERNPFFSQGMLAGDMLTTMLASGTDPLAQSWLSSVDGWAPSLLNLLMRLAVEKDIHQRRDQHGRIAEYDAGGCSVITQRGLSMLRRLAEKVDRSMADGGLTPVAPSRLRVLSAMLSPHFEIGSLRVVSGFAGLD